ncbi:MAG TPA: FAD-dependent oxidoreductase [Candidatus Dormibacteraeota bacterium]
MQDEKFDAIVVGAGPAGISAAITMAKAGLQVVVLEKGEKPGAKNVMGGILYRQNLEEVVGDAWREAPVERPMIEEQRWFMTKDAALRLLGHKNFRHREHPNSFSVLRARFDPWYASKAEEVGAFVINETVVESLIVREGKVVGVTTGREGDLFADVVIVCEGIGLGMRLLERAGLKKPIRANQAAIAVKEVMALDPEKIEERFNCEPGEGCAVECFGDSTFGKAGFMFIYTNKDTLSVGGGVLVSDYSGGVVTAKDVGRVDHGLLTPNELLEHFKSHPAIKPLLKGAETVEYLAKMIPEAGYKAMPRLYGNGYLVCGDAAMMANPVHREGSNLAMASGRMAGETVIQAKELGDFSERTLVRYKGRIDNSWIAKDMKKYNGAVPLLEENPKMLGKYPELLDRALDEFFRVDGASKWEKQNKILGMFAKEGGPRMLWDTVKAAWTMK